jgi:hypothetical protein
MSKRHYERLKGISITEEELARRLGVFESIVITHKKFEQLYETIRECHVLQKYSPNKKGICFLGETGAGKSTLLKIYEDDPSFKKKKIINGHECTSKITPVLRVELDSNSKPANVASKMLEVLGEPYYYKGSEKDLTFKLKRYLEDGEVELIIIDELQHLVDTDTKRVIKKAADWLKQLLNDVNIPIVFSGIREEANKIFKNNDQLDERFPHKIFFSGFKYSDDKQSNEFRAFLKNMDCELPLAENSNLSDPYLTEKIYYVTLGMPRTLNHLLYYSLKIVLKNGSDKIEEKDLKEAFDMLTFSTRPKVINPFNGKPFDLKIALEKEGFKM